MEFSTEHLHTFRKVIEAGTLDKAARIQNITASAVSQRLKVLERQAGSVLSIRSKPIRTAGGGDLVSRLAREIQMLSTEAHRSLDLGTNCASDLRRTALAIVVNAD